MTRWFARLWIAAVAVAAGPLHAAAGVPVDGTLAESRAALRVDDWTLSTASLQALLRVVRLQKDEVTATQVAAAVAEDRVLGGYARRHYSDAQLFSGARVRFSPEALADSSLVTTLEAAFREPLAKAMGPDAGYVLERHALSAERLAQLLDRGTGLRLDDRLPPSREAALKTVVLLAAKVGSEPYKVTLHDVWAALDVQGRNALYRGDAAFALSQADQLARDRFVLGWARQSSPLGADGVRQLRQLVIDRQRRDALARLRGAGGDPHYSSPEVERLQREVEPAAIRAYYDTHKSEFQRTEKVLVRSLRFPGAKEARAASAALAQGARFEDVARRLGGGDGAAHWLGIDDARRRWIAQLAFAQAPGAASEPVREPEVGSAPGWVIVQVERRVTGFHPVNSETVRFAASEAIARQRAAAGFAQLRKDLLDRAQVRVNPRALGVDTMPAGLEPGS